jgi:hypothetical protein
VSENLIETECAVPSAREPAEPERRGGPFRRGHDPRRNLAGRPRTGLALAETIRRKVDPEQIVDMLLRLAADETVPLDKRLVTLLPWVQLGYLRPPTTAAVRVETSSGAPALDVSAMPLEVQRELLAAIQRARAALPVAIDDGEQMVDG